MVLSIILLYSSFASLSVYAEEDKPQVTEHKITEEEIGEKATCPVMKRSFTVSKDTPAIEFQGTTYYFCCPGCIGKFMASQTESDSLKVKSDSLKTDPDSLHHNKDTGGTRRRGGGCC